MLGHERRHERIDGPGLGWSLCGTEFEAHKINEIFCSWQIADLFSVQQVASARGHTTAFQPIPCRGIGEAADGDDLKIVPSLFGRTTSKHCQRRSHLTP